MVGPKTLLRTLETRNVEFRVSSFCPDRLEVIYDRGEISKREAKLIEKYHPEILQILKTRDAAKFLADSINTILHGDSFEVLKSFQRALLTSS